MTEWHGVCARCSQSMAASPLGSESACTCEPLMQERDEWLEDALLDDAQDDARREAPVEDVW